MPRLKSKRVSTRYQLVSLHDQGDIARPTVRLNVRLYNGNDIAMGPGKADLLEAIERTGSISAAGKSLDMSYRRAWILMDEMNRCFNQPVVETAKGGTHGGGAHLTPFGHEVLARYREMYDATRNVTSSYLALFMELMRDQPLPPGSGMVLSDDDARESEIGG